MRFGLQVLRRAENTADEGQGLYRVSAALQVSSRGRGRCRGPSGEGEREVGALRQRPCARFDVQSRVAGRSALLTQCHFCRRRRRRRPECRYRTRRHRPMALSHDAKRFCSLVTKMGSLCRHECLIMRVSMPVSSRTSELARMHAQCDSRVPVDVSRSAPTPN